MVQKPFFLRLWHINLTFYFEYFMTISYCILEQLASPKNLFCLNGCICLIQLYIFVLTFVNFQRIHVAFIICINSLVEESDKKSTTVAVYESVLNSPKGSNEQYEPAVFENSMPSSCGKEDLESEAYRASLTNVLYETSKTELSAQSKKEV